MPSKVERSNWDFSPVYDLLSSLSGQAPDQARERAVGDGSPLAQKPIPPAKHHQLDTLGDPRGVVSLGDFGKVWDFLGVQRNAPVPTIAPFEASLASQNNDKEAYASDGALFYPPSSRNVQWRDQVEEREELGETVPESPPGHDNLTKRQRKRRREKARRDAKIHKVVQNPQEENTSNVTSSSDEVDSAAQTTATTTKAPKSRFNGDAEPKDSTKPPGTHKTSATGVVSSPQSKKVVGISEKNASQAKSYQSDSVLQPFQSMTPQNIQISNSQVRGTANQSIKRTASDVPAQPTIAYNPYFHSHQKPLNSHWPVANPAGESQRSFNSSIAQPNFNQIFRYQVEAPLPGKSLAALPTTTRNSAYRKIQPLYADSDPTGRNWNLLLKLINHFPEDKKHLLSPLQLTLNTTRENGVHVFVDASNILIGFYQHLKRARGIPDGARVPRVYPSFHALALLLERRRPVAKRELVGSTPEIPAFEEARQIGYKTCILEKVFKSREMTERQRKFALRDQARANGHSSGYGTESHGTDSAAINGGNGMLPPQQPKWVEQGVDEVLHLKMVESILDRRAPGAENAKDRPTMIVATGDASEAEYSAGFLKNVERALNNGWNVEVAAWGANISQEYWALERKGRWRGRFRVVKLDDFAEELFPAEEG